MRGRTPQQPSMICLVNIENWIPQNHPLRPIKKRADQALRKLSRTFDRMYSKMGRPSVPPEQLLKALLLMALYSIRSEVQFCEQLQYNMLFRWFLDMNLDERPFDHCAFSDNRERLLRHGVAGKFLRQTWRQAGDAGLLSDDHFSVDGSLIEAWASTKSFRPKDDNDDDDSNGWSDFKGKGRSNETHESKTDPEARLYRKARGKEAKLSFMAHALMENRNGLILDLRVTQATGRAEREAALDMLRSHRGARRRTLGADAGYNTRDFVAACRALKVTPHVAGKQRTALDGRTTRHRGYEASQRVRKRIEQIYGWLKTSAGLRKSRLRGTARTGLLAQMGAAAYNLLRISKLTAGTA